jgi:hypothetical protein
VTSQLSWRPEGAFKKWKPLHSWLFAVWDKVRLIGIFGWAKERVGGWSGQ